MNRQPIRDPEARRRYVRARRKVVPYLPPALRARIAEEAAVYGHATAPMPAFCGDPRFAARCFREAFKAAGLGLGFLSWDDHLVVGLADELLKDRRRFERPGTSEPKRRPTPKDAA